MGPSDLIRPYEGSKGTCARTSVRMAGPLIFERGPKDLLPLPFAQAGPCADRMVVASTPTPWLGHHEILVECDEDAAEKVVAWLEKAMIDGMEEVLNGPGVGGPRVPVEVETQIGETWAG